MVHASKVATIGARIEAANVPKMQSAIRRVKELFTFDAIVHYVTSFINEVRLHARVGRCNKGTESGKTLGTPCTLSWALHADGCSTLDGAVAGSCRSCRIEQPTGKPSCMRTFWHAVLAGSGCSSYG